MRNDLLQIVLSVLVLVLGAAAEECLPKMLGIGFPVLLVAVQCVASRRPLSAAALFAVAAGAMEDGVSSLAPMTSVSYFLAVAILVRLAGIPRLATALTFPCYQVWLAIWTGGLEGGIFGRILLAIPVGLVTAPVVGAALAWAERKAAIDELG